MTAGTMRVLGGEVSPFTARARLALELRGVAYELLDEPLGPKKSDRLLAANPVYGKIPVLLLPDGRAICESAVIVQYVEDVARGSGGAEAGGLLLPDDPYERAMHRFWTVFIDDKFWPALDAVSLAPTKDARVQAVVDTRAALNRLEEAFKDRSNGAAFFSGRDTAPGLLDLALGCFLPALRSCERLHGLSLMDASTTPLLDGWSRRFAAHPAAKRILPDTDKVVQFTRFLQAKFGVHES
ncbi:probable glutathione S-transferase BZ2 [Miscanthus floridulus]|uniref:probable glutathione S-transferase BZ2 n=1 Tax=Miscanthus floridulus TaxID=154761 RepID=UPI003458EDAD